MMILLRYNGIRLGV